jgi:hypothetical protein
MKKCSKCGRNLPLRSFAKMTASKDGRQPRCRQCHKAYRAYWRMGLSGALTEANPISASMPTTSHPTTKQRRKRKRKQQ